ncbi:MAG: hypothetical protein AMXMBFR46_17310 [Acidimicrobiia bacterium]
MLVGLSILVAAAASSASVALSAGPATAQAGGQAADPVAHADAAIARLRAEADGLATRYFEALGALADVERRTDEIESRLPALAAEVARLRDLTRARAVVAYMRSGHDLGAVASADDPLQAARRAQWLDRLNARDAALTDELKATSARLTTQRTQLRAARDEAATTLDAVREQGRAMDALLAEAQERRRIAVTAAATATASAAAPATGAGAPGSGTGTAAGSASGPGTTAPTSQPGTTKPSPPATPAPPPDYVPTGGVHPHHDDPFLVCTRARESGGRYNAVNPAGPYLGAYQFLQATWNGIANRSGRPELIGVPPNVASPYDQDDMAWALYQAAGSGPWGGHCDE